PPIPDVDAFWRKVDQCDPPDVKTTALVTTSTAACAEHRGVELVTVEGGRHQWPGGTTFLERLGPRNALNATQTIWQFFAAHAG
ncbi:MAG: polyhydroxybutyrate depolymerase, partial [Mycobacterium sp.]